MSRLPAPPTSPAAGLGLHENTHFSSAREDSSVVPLPVPPTETNTSATLRMRFAEYYWPRHFERNPVDLAAFIDRIMTDYAHYEP